MNAESPSVRRVLAAGAIALVAAIVREPVERSDARATVSVDPGTDSAGSRVEPGTERAAIRVEPRTEAELATTVALAEEIWTEEPSVGAPLVAVLAQPARASLAVRDVPYAIVDHDIDASAAAEHQRLAHRDQVDDWFAEYRDVEELHTRMLTLAAKYPTLATLRQPGRSLEGRSIPALEISHGGRRTIAITGGHHGREWIAVMVPMCIADRLVTRYDRDPRIRRILDAVKFVVAPLVNPDGYHYTWTNDRYWRKNRRGGYGVDLGRNYSVAWGGAGSSGDKKSPNYRGEKAFSEPETRAVRAIFEQGPVAAHVDFHSFSQVIAYPWSHKRAQPADRDAFASIATLMSTAMRASHDHAYKVRPGSEFTSSVSGTPGDWSYGMHDALSFLVELRPSSRQGGGFVIPPDQIAPTCDEAMAGVLALAEWTIANR